MTDLPDDLVELTLVPVEVFGGDCDCHIAAGHSDAPTEGVPDGMTALRGPAGEIIRVVERCTGWSYGLSDAVSAWSDCNRAEGRIYRVDDTGPEYRLSGDTVRVWVSRADLPWFEKRFGERQHEEGP